MISSGRNDQPGANVPMRFGWRPVRKLARVGEQFGCAGVEAIEPQARRGDLVEHGRLDVRMAVVAGLFPAVIVAHHQDDVGKRLRLGDLAEASASASTRSNLIARLRWSVDFRGQNPARGIVRNRRRLLHVKRGRQIAALNHDFAPLRSIRVNFSLGCGVAVIGRIANSAVRRILPGVMSKHIFVTGGVVCSLGKGLTASSIALLLERRGLRVRMQKLDPYINVDPGTMSPYQHGEVYVLDDGAETDLDLGHYERFTNSPLSREVELHDRPDLPCA